MKLSELQNKNYTGIDVSIEISLYEYGLLINDSDLNDIQVIFGVGGNGSEYDTFGHFNISENEINSLLSERWVNKDNFLSSCGMTEKEWLQLSPVNKLNDLIFYFGYLNICGDVNSFEIENDLS